MNSHERVMAVFQGRAPDRVPWGEWSVDSDSVGKVIGRFIFGSSHSIAVGTPYENFMAMADEFVKVRDY